MIPRRIAALSSPSPRAISRYTFFLRQSRCLSIETNGLVPLHPAPPKGPVIVDFEEQVGFAESEVPRPSKIPHSLSQPLTKLEEYQRQKAAKQAADKLGATLEDFYQPHELITNPPSPRDITLELLLASGAHLGHATALWNPGNQRFIFGIRQGIHLISLDVIAAHLRRAAKVVHGVSKNGGLIIFVGTREGQERSVVEAAKRTRGYHITERWVPGTITNKDQLLGDQQLRILDSLDQEIKLTLKQKKELQDKLAASPKKNAAKTTINDTLQVPVGFGGVRPDLVVCLNPLENRTMLQECAQYRIPTIGIVDTDVDPTCVTYPIPANDDSLRSVQLIVGVLGRAGQEGRFARYEEASERMEELEKRQKREAESKRDEEESASTTRVYQHAELAASEARQRELEEGSLV